MSDQDDLHAWSAKALRGEVRRLRRLLTDQMRTGTEFQVESIVNDEYVPYVQMRWGVEAAQMTPDEARRHALIFTDAAAAAEFDAALMLALTDESRGPALEEETVRGLLGMVRQKRVGDINASLRRQERPKRPPPPRPKARRA